MNKKANDWILCPSTSFPGKFYYFNVKNGKVAWSSNEFDKKNEYKYPFETVQEAVNSNRYPEPQSPLENPNMSNAANFEFGKHFPPSLYTYAPTPIFGQPMMPNSVPFMFNHLLWPPQVPSNVFPSVRDRTPKFNQSTQTRDPDHLLYHHYSTPNTKKFTDSATNDFNLVPKRNERSSSSVQQNSLFTRIISNSEDSKVHISKKNDQKHAGQSKQNKLHDYKLSIEGSDTSFSNSDLIQHIYEEREESQHTVKESEGPKELFTKHINSMNQFDNKFNELKTLRSLFDSENASLNYSGQHKPLSIAKIEENGNTDIYEGIPKSCDDSRKNLSMSKTEVCDNTSFENETVIYERTPKLSLNNNKSLSNFKRKVYDDTAVREGTSESLNENDLRLVLMNKKRKLGVTEITSDRKNSPKKRVTFAMEVDNVKLKDQGCLVLEGPKAMANPKKQNEVWYIVTDIDILLNEYAFIEKYVKKDRSCRLYVSHTMYSEIEKMCVDKVLSRERMVAARRLYRQLGCDHPYLVVQVPDDLSNSMNESVLDTCIRLQDLKFNVIYITNDNKLYNEGNCHVQCFKLQEIKEDHEIKKTSITFDIKKINNQNNIKNKIKATNDDDSLMTTRKFKLRNLVVERNTNNVETLNLKSKLFDRIKMNSTDGRNEDPILETDNNNNSRSIFSKTNKQNTLCDANEHETFDNGYKKLNSSSKRETVAEENNYRLEEIPKFTSDVNSKQPSSSVDDNLHRFNTRDDAMASRIIVRLDEWVCSFTQIAEDVLADVLREYASSKSCKLSPPWTLHEAVQCVSDAYGGEATIKKIAGKLSFMLFYNSCKKGKLRGDISPNEFLKLVGCAILLIKALQRILPSMEDLCSAEEKLRFIVRNIEDPRLDVEDPVKKGWSNTPPINKSEKDNSRRVQTISLRKHIDVKQYIEKHFMESKTNSDTEVDCNETETNERPRNKQHGSKFIRTVGENLISPKINEEKKMHLQNKKEEKQSDRNKVVSTAPIERDINVVSPDFSLPEPEKCTPKVIRNIIIIDEFEKRYVNKKKHILEEHDDCNAIVNEARCDASKPISIKFKSNRKNKSIVNNDERNNSEHAINLSNSNNNNVNSNIVNQDNLPDDTFDTKIKKDIVNVCEPEKVGLKVIRKISAIDAFEKKCFNNKDSFDLEAHDYSDEKFDGNVCKLKEINSNFGSKGSIVNNDKNNNPEIDHSDNLTIDEQHNMSGNLIIDEQDNISDNLLIDEQDNISDNLIIDEQDNISALNNAFDTRDNKKETREDSNDSGIDNESIEAHSLVKPFLYEMNLCFMDTYKFITTTVELFREEKIPDAEKNDLRVKTDKKYGHIVAVIEVLKRIIQRESNKDTCMKTQLIKAGVKVTDNEWVAGYRQVVTKYLEQAQILEFTLNLTKKLTGYHVDQLAHSSLL